MTTREILLAQAEALDALCDEQGTFITISHLIIRHKADEYRALAAQTPAGEAELVDEHGWPMFEGIPPSAEQQAERMAAFEAQLAEAVELFKRIGYAMDAWSLSEVLELVAKIEKAREVMG